MIEIEPPRKPRVLFFDYWTKGIDKFARVVRVAPHDAEYALFHLGSFRDRAVPEREVLRDIQCVDIAAFRGESLIRIVQSFEPNVIVGLNMSSLFDRAIFLTAQSLSIPTVFLQHGSWGDRDEIRRLLVSLDNRFTWGDRIRRIPKFMKLIPWYLESRGGTLIDFQFWHLLARLAWTPTLSHFYPTAPEELQPTLALVFKEGDAETLVRTHRMPRERIEIVGNPELDDVARLKTTGLSADERSARLEGFGFDYGKAVVCYLEDGFVEQQQCFGWTEKRRVELMMELANAVTNIGAQLLIRPHPGSNADAMRRAFAGRHGSVVTRDGGLIGAAAVADVVMGTLSTALETPVILGRPILVPLWHIDGDASASPFLRYGVAEAVDHPGMLSHCLSTALKSPASVDKSTFLRERLGPVDGKSAARVSKAVLGAAVDHIAGAY